MKISTLFKTTNKLQRTVYAVNTGYLIGHFLTIIDFDKDKKEYLVLACKIDEVDPKTLNIPEKDMLEGINKGVLTYVETLKRTYFRDCKKVYNFNKKTK